MTDLLQHTRPMATVDHPLHRAAHRKPDPVPSGPIARFVDNHVLPHIRGTVYGLGLAVLALAAEAVYLDVFGPRAAIAFALEIVAVWSTGVVVGTQLCKRIDAAAPPSSSSARHRKVA